MKRKPYFGSIVFLAVMFLWLFMFSFRDPVGTSWVYQIFTLVATIAFTFEAVKRYRQMKREAKEKKEKSSV